VTKDTVILLLTALDCHDDRSLTPSSTVNAKKRKVSTSSSKAQVSKKSREKRIRSLRKVEVFDDDDSSSSTVNIEVVDDERSPPSSSVPVSGKAAGLLYGPPTIATRANHDTQASTGLAKFNAQPETAFDPLNTGPPTPPSLAYGPPSMPANTTPIRANTLTESSGNPNVR
jgi:hypothetical protein